MKNRYRPNTNHERNWRLVEKETDFLSASFLKLLFNYRLNRPLWSIPDVFWPFHHLQDIRRK